MSARTRTTSTAEESDSSSSGGSSRNSSIDGSSSDEEEIKVIRSVNGSKTGSNGGSARGSGSGSVRGSKTGSVRGSNQQLVSRQVSTQSRDSGKQFRNGFGLITVTPCVEELIRQSTDGAVELTFSYTWTPSVADPSDRIVVDKKSSSIEINWKAVLTNGHLYLNVPNGVGVERNKEAFVTLLEFAEEELNCSHIVVCFNKSRPERGKLTPTIVNNLLIVVAIVTGTLMRMFMFLGFATLAPGNSLIPVDATEGTIYMAYELV